jgi:sulfate-transporting ATPase
LLGDAIQAGLFVIAASSIVLLTGWVGQISLAQAAFVGIGAFGSANLIRAWHLPFPFSLIAAGVIAAGAALILGLVALRVRGLYLAVTTLIFAYMCDAYLFVAPYFAGSGGVSSAPQPEVGDANAFPYFDLSDRRTFYFIIVAVAATMLFALSNLRDSKTGRAFFALRGSEMAAASLGIDVTRYKLIAFAVAGGIAGVAGNLLLVGQGSVVSAQFGINIGLLYLAIAVVGGLESLGGLVVSALIIAARNELFFRIVALTGYLDIVSAGLLTVVLLVYPGGLAAVPQAINNHLGRLRTVWERVNRDRASEGEGARSHAWRTRRSSAARTNFAVPAPVPLTIHRPAPTIEEVPPYPVEASTVTETERLDFTRLGDDPGVTATLVPFGEALLETRNVRVEFEGLVAVADASLRLDQGQIVGLIGPNGAGKTTLFNAISGLETPTSGTVHLFGEEVTAKPVHERARRGLGRTFQAIQLFSQLSVYENLLVATHTNNPCRLIDNVALTRRGLRYEAAAADAVRRVINFMGLTDVADRAVSGLPFGILRQVEIARTLVTGSPIVMLDEPASGLDNAETDRLSELLFGLREGLGLTLLLIEHDVRMVTEVSDYMYVLVHGEIISQGTPSEVRADPEVIGAYLGDSTAPVVEAVSA